MQQVQPSKYDKPKPKKVEEKRLEPPQPKAKPVASKASPVRKAAEEHKIEEDAPM